MIGLNPVVLFHTVGGGHVDVLVMLAVAAAIYFVATQRELPATVALTVGAFVKISAAVPLALLIAYVVTRAEPSRRWKVAAAHIGTVMGIAIHRRRAVHAAIEPHPRHGGARATRLLDRAARPGRADLRGGGHRGRRRSRRHHRHRARPPRHVRGARRRLVHDHASGHAPRQARVRSRSSRPRGDGRSC